MIMSEEICLYGYDCKIYNRLCSNIGKPGSDIVEYFKDIRNNPLKMPVLSLYKKYIPLEIVELKLYAGITFSFT